MSFSSFDKAANGNFMYLKKVDKMKKKSIFFDRNALHKNNNIVKNFRNEKTYFLSQKFNDISNDNDVVKSCIEKNKAFIKERLKEKTKISQLKSLRKDNNIEPIKIIVNNSKYEIDAKKQKPKIKKVIIDKIKNINKKKIECIEKETIISIKIKLNPLNIRKNLQSNNKNIIDRMYQTEKTGFKYCLNNFDRMSNNYLSIRKTLDIFNTEEKKNINSNFGFNPNYNNRKIKFIELNNEKSKSYSKYFLPSSGYWLKSKE